jgi:hypothetical protein
MKATGSRRDEPEPRPVSTLAGALWQEFEAIHDDPRPVAAGQGPDASLRAYYSAALAQNQAALCLSGGGIRSAAFSLGVLQALAQKRLLTGFHYLSTVSGGGFIGGWLAALLHAHEGDAARVEGLLAGREAMPELRALRAYTNFLAPRPGVASPDTWAGIVLWVRNVLVNWLIFLPALFALALVPGLYADLLAAIGPGWSWPLLLLALLCLGGGVYNGALHLPSHAVPERASLTHRTGFVPRLVVAPLILWSILVPLVAAPWLRPVMPGDAILGDVIPVLAFLVMELAYLAAAFHHSGPDRALFRRNFGWWTLASLSATLVLWLALDLGIGVDPRYIAVLGPLAVTLAHLVQSLIYVAFRKEAFRGDVDREWLARLSGEKVVPALLWAIFAAVCLLLPPLVFEGWETRVVPFLVSAGGLLTGPIAAYIGKVSKDVPGLKSNDVAGQRFVLPLNILLALVSAVFAAVLFLLLARLGSLLAGGSLLIDVVLLAIAIVLALALGQRINVNRFSMHAVYRSRIVRGFLGPARQGRAPDDFTGIDPHDNPRMTALAARDRAKRVLFPVVNTTLNLVSGSNNAWAERKAESFTITPTACGAAYLHKSEDVAAGLPARGAYARTEAYAGIEQETGPDDRGGGITLGTAVTLSGAAASPSMGYHSSSGAAFLMTLFNVRLGAWLPNPALASAAQLRRAKPPNALVTLARELLGLTHDRGGAVYLSDGGHFENLGLYEMVRRRCRYILVIDAGEDPRASFDDLGNAVRKIRIDFDVRIEFQPPVAIGSRDKPVDPFRSFACATIHYPESPAVPGQLIYLKPADPPGSPIDVRAYRNLHDKFPHETTLEQFFTESRFESYRQLGEAEVGVLGQGADSLPVFFETASQQVATKEPIG